ncbi:U-box domain-containing protein [Endozoicomonas sp.]|uniref:U-box domain-containing protein n=1 Tax=Endozoicomonas sp. TaxID=1892382 RepID=UPI00383A18F0
MIDTASLNPRENAITLNNRINIHSESQKDKDKVRIKNSCQDCGRAFEINPDQLPRKTAITQRKIQVQASKQYKAELGQIRESLINLLDAGVITELDSCREHFETLIESDKSVLRHEKGFILSVTNSDQTEITRIKIKKSFVTICQLIEDTTKLDHCGSYSKQRFEFLLLLLKHYMFSVFSGYDLQPELEKIVDNLNKGISLDESMTESINHLIGLCKSILSHYIVFDLILEGNFDKDSRLFTVIRDKVNLGLNVSYLDIVDDKHWKLNFEFDDSTNVQLLWVLFSVLEYWNYSERKGLFLNLYTKALNDQRSIDLHDDNSFINYISMRISSISDIENLFTSEEMRKEYSSHLLELNKDKLLNHATPIERSVFLLKSFSTSDELASVRITNYNGTTRSISLYDYFKERSNPTALRRLLSNKTLHQQTTVEDILKKFQNEKLLTIKMQEIRGIIADQSKLANMENSIKSLTVQTEILSNKRVHLSSETELLSNKKRILMVDIFNMKTKFKSMSEFTTKTLAEVTCPISLMLMEKAVMTVYGHSYDEKSILKCLKIKKECPMTRQTLTEKQLYPNLSLQGIINSIPEDDIENMNSIMREITKSIGKDLESSPTEH